MARFLTPQRVSRVRVTGGKAPRRGLSVGGSGTFTPVAVVNLTGLVSTAFHGLHAQSGDTIGYEVASAPDGATVTGQSWRVGTLGASTEAGTGTTIAASAALYDQQDLFVRVSFSGGLEVASNLATIRYAPAENTAAPVIEGGTGLNDLLTLSSYGVWDADGPDDFTIRWFRDGAQADPGLGEGYPVGLIDSGASIYAVVTREDSGGAVTAQSNTIVIQTFTAPTAAASVTLDNTTPAAGETITVTATAVNGNPAATRTISWYRDNVLIVGATGASYTATGSDVGSVLKARVTDTNALATVFAESAPTAAVVEAEITALVTPILQEQYSTQLVNELTGYADLVPASFDSPGQTIVSVDVQTSPSLAANTWTTRTGTYPLETGQAVRVRVEDSAAAVETWLLVAEVVPEVTAAVVSGNRIALTIDPLVTDNAEQIEFTANGQSYAPTFGALTTAPVVLEGVAISGGANPDVGSTTQITPPIFVYDDALGGVAVAYTTNGANAVNVSDPDNPTLLVAAGDAGVNLTVTATITQGAQSVQSVSNSIAIPAGGVWSAPVITAGDNQATVARQGTPDAAPGAPTVVAGNAEATITEAA